jgi:hypothetical protein
VRFEFESGTFQLFYLYSLSLENRVCLSRGVQVVRAAWLAATMIVVGVGDLVQMTTDGRTGRVTLCVVYIMHMETRIMSFLVEPQN